MKFFIFLVSIFLLVQASVVVSRVVRINNGKNAYPGQFPYQASIQWGVPPFIKMKHACAGSIIHERWIMTAGHCFTSSPPFGKNKVLVGLQDIYIINEYVQIFEVERIVLHEDYPGGVSPNDIALLKLKGRITYDEFVGPVELPVQGSIQTGDSIISGWGANCNVCFQEFRSNLQTTTLPIVTNEECETVCKAINEFSHIYANQMCTISRDNSNTCPGDSGGPLVQNVNGKMVQVGIISWDLLPCGSDNSPTVYTRVSSFIDWINSKIGVD